MKELPAPAVHAGPTFLITCTLALAFVYWEGGVLLRALRERQAAEAARRRREREARRRRGGGIFGSWDSGGAADGTSESGDAGDSSQVGSGFWEDWGPEPPPPPEPTRMERARYERRRSLGYLALVTAVLIWMTGVVSGPTPFQP